MDEKKDLKTSVERDILREKLMKEIAAVQKRSRTEKQPKKQFELYQKLRTLQKKLEELE